MGTLIFNAPIIVRATINRTSLRKSGESELRTRNLQFCRHQKIGVRGVSRICRYSQQSGDNEEDSQNSVQELRVPDHWLEPSKASQESEWLRVTLKKWLDDEYCPEDTNVEISKVAANSFYKSLVENRAELGEILLKMALELESISYQESFHGAFSSANAAVNLIIQRILAE